MWLEMYLKDVYEKAEAWGSEAWVVAREWKGKGVNALVRGLGLENDIVDGDDGGDSEKERKQRFVVMSVEELEVQIKWKREGDCEFSPLFCIDVGS